MFVNTHVRINQLVFTDARVAKSADAKDLKSFSPQGECGFKSRPGHHLITCGVPEKRQLLWSPRLCSRLSPVRSKWSLHSLSRQVEISVVHDVVVVEN